MQCNLLFSSGLNHLQNLTPKCNILNVLWTKIASKRRIEQFKFLNCLLNVKNLVLSNGSEHERNVTKRIKIVFSPKKLQKIAQRLDTFELH